MQAICMCAPAVMLCLSRVCLIYSDQRWPSCEPSCTVKVCVSQIANQGQPEQQNAEEHCIVYENFSPVTAVACPATSQTHMCDMHKSLLITNTLWLVPRTRPPCLLLTTSPQAMQAPSVLSREYPSVAVPGLQPAAHVSSSHVPWLP